MHDCIIMMGHAVSNSVQVFTSDVTNCDMISKDCLGCKC